MPPLLPLPALQTNDHPTDMSEKIRQTAAAYSVSERTAHRYLLRGAFPKLADNLTVTQVKVPSAMPK